jgi:hypothetical protein
MGPNQLGLINYPRGVSYIDVDSVAATSGLAFLDEAPGDRPLFQQPRVDPILADPDPLLIPVHIGCAYSHENARMSRQVAAENLRFPKTICGVISIYKALAF